jgi:tetratricopeptide (TPR) repeat protein
VSWAAVFGPPGGAVARADDFDRGILALHQGLLTEAIQHWSRYIKRHPDSYAAHVNRGSAYLHSGLIHRGIRDWKRARDVAPPFTYGVYTGYYVLNAEGAGKLLGFAAPLEIDPEYTCSVLSAGALLVEMGRLQDAADLYQNAKELTKNPLLKSKFEYWIETLVK